MGEQSGQTKKRSKQRPVAGQAVQVGRCQVRVAVDADVAPALVVGKDHQNVRLARRSGFSAASSSGQRRQQHQGGEKATESV